MATLFYRFSFLFVFFLMAGCSSSFQQASTRGSKPNRIGKDRTVETSTRITLQQSTIVNYE